MLVGIVLISVMNVMMMAVYERIREIGTIAAIGTPPRRILGLFLAEGLASGGSSGRSIWFCKKRRAGSRAGRPRIGRGRNRSADRRIRRSARWSAPRPDAETALRRAIPPRGASRIGKEGSPADCAAGRSRRLAQWRLDSPSCQQRARRRRDGVTSGCGRYGERMQTGGIRRTLRSVHRWSLARRR